MSDLPEDLQQLLQTHVPSFPAAEVLVFLAQHRSESWTANAVGQAMRPSSLSPQDIQEYLALFHAHGLIAGNPDTSYQYQPADPKIGSAVESLVKAYNEKPVTLIRTIYALADRKLRSFADAFKLKEDHP